MPCAQNGPWFSLSVCLGGFAMEEEETPFDKAAVVNRGGRRAQLNGWRQCSFIEVGKKKCKAYAICCARNVIEIYDEIFWSMANLVPFRENIHCQRSSWAKWFKEKWSEAHKEEEAHTQRSIFSHLDRERAIRKLMEDRGKISRKEHIRSYTP